MATANFSEHEKQNALNIFQSIIAFLGNVLILVALRKESSLYPPSKSLLCNLAATDLCVGLVVSMLHGYYAGVVSLLVPHFFSNFFFFLPFFSVPTDRPTQNQKTHLTINKEKNGMAGRLDDIAAFL